MAIATSAINDYIENILHARYGEQVRGSIVSALQWYDNMDVTITTLPVGSEPSASIDNTGDNPVLELSLPDMSVDVATINDAYNMMDAWVAPDQRPR